MSIWTNSALAALACAGLSACAGLDLVSPARSIVVLGGAVNVTPPAGYCAKPNVSKDGGDSAVVLIGRCAATSKAVPALMTASIGAAGSGTALDAGPVALTSFFTSDQGRAMLASTGKARDAIVTASEYEAGSVLLLVKDSTLGQYWRGILAVKGRLVMLSATGGDSESLPPAEGRALLSNTILSLRKANEAQPKGAPPRLWPFAPEQSTQKAAELAPAAPIGPRPKARPLP